MQFREIDDTKELMESAKAIFMLFLTEESEFELNITQTTVQPIHDIIYNHPELISKDLFHKLEFEVQWMLNDNLERFYANLDETLHKNNRRRKGSMKRFSFSLLNQYMAAKEATSEPEIEDRKFEEKSEDDSIDIQNAIESGRRRIRSANLIPDFIKKVSFKRNPIKEAISIETLEGIPTTRKTRSCTNVLLIFLGYNH